MLASVTSRYPRFRVLVLLLIGPLSFCGVLVSSGLLLFPIMYAHQHALSRPWMVGMAAVSVLGLAGLFAAALRAFLARRTLLRECSVDSVVFISGVVLWIAAVPLLLALIW